MTTKLFRNEKYGFDERSIDLPGADTEIKITELKFKMR